MLSQMLCRIRYLKTVEMIVETMDDVHGTQVKNKNSKYTSDAYSNEDVKYLKQ